MPLYDIEHICRLSASQKDALATAITAIHAEKFTTPKIFVNVRFVDLNATEQVLYVAGKKRATNRIIANVRAGPGRTSEMWDEVCGSLSDAWKDIVGSSGDDDEKELRAVFILGSIIGGAEAGFPLPKAGEDQEWLQTHMKEFQRLAGQGDEEMKEMIEEIEERGLLKGVEDGRA